MTEDVKEILLKSSKSKTSVNSDILLDIDLSANEKKFPSNGISANIDQYRQYIKEKDASNKYRFVFTINPVCSNVLYNHISEIVTNSTRIESSGMYVKGVNNEYVKYKYGKSKIITPELLVKDTGYSHKECGNFTYYPGIDIFNNHRFRGEEFVIVADKGNAETCHTYNTIEDTLREYNGEVLQTISRKDESDSHLYFKDSTKTFQESINDNLVERDGWFGFINPTSLDLVNCKLESSSISINKVINNRKPCEFIDLYPDRTLFSFMPNKNETLKREEYNWDYCITYPYKNFYENELISLLNILKKPILNGMLAEFCDSSGNKLTDSELNGLLTEENRGDEFSDIILRTKIKNNIKSGDYVKIHLVINSAKYFTIKTNVKVRNIGIGGYNTMYYFTVNKGDILSGLKTISNKNRGSISGLRCYVQRVVNGRPCKYYFRKFRRLPNFKNTNVHNDEKLSNNAIKSVIFNDFNSSLNKLGFGTNIYGDRMAQIVYNDDIDTTNIYDNLGRPLHELFLTIIKTNNGNTLWYDSKNYSDTSIECSHCFSQISAGLDIPWPYDEDENDDYNIHKIHNIPSTFEHNPKFPDSVKALEENITKSGSTKTISIRPTTKKTHKKTGDYDGTFFGDVVELDELNVEEYVLEDVQHRFNTMQREYTKDGEFSAMTINEIETDDYDSKFKVLTKNYLGDDTDFYVNLAAEGYYYKSHYRIPIKEFSDTVNEGQHIIVKFDSLDFCSSEGEYIIESGITDKNYYFEPGGTILIYNKKTDKKYTETILDVFGDDFRCIRFTVHANFNMDKDEFNFFKPNPIKPKTAYDFDDGSGIYKWRDIESFEFINSDSELYDNVFTNGAHYIHQNINFFLRRQDPYGLYGLNPVNNFAFPYEYQLLEQPGKEKDITQAQHFTEGDIQLC